MRAFNSRVVANNAELSPAGAVTLQLLHIATSLKDGISTPQFLCGVSLSFLVPVSLRHGKKRWQA